MLRMPEPSAVLQEDPEQTERSLTTDDASPLSESLRAWNVDDRCTFVYVGSMAASQDEKELWVGWTRDAISRYLVPEEIDDADDLVDDMVDVATKYADSMLDEYEERFSKRARGGTRHRKRTTAETAEED